LDARSIFTITPFSLRSTTTGTAARKIEAFEKAGVKVAEKPSDVAKLLMEELNQRF
jgi:succinyl-CoA synthetase alpha subunit